MTYVQFQNFPFTSEVVLSQTLGVERIRFLSQELIAPGFSLEFFLITFGTQGLGN